METVLSIDELVDKVGSKYVLVSLAAKRARELIEGSEPLINVQYYQHKNMLGRVSRPMQDEVLEELKPTTIALLEILNGKIYRSKEIGSMTEKEETEARR